MGGARYSFLISFGLNSFYQNEYRDAYKILLIIKKVIDCYRHCRRDSQIRVNNEIASSRTSYHNFIFHVIFLSQSQLKRRMGCVIPPHG